MAKDDIVDAEAASKPSADQFFTGVVIFTTLILVVGWVVLRMAEGNVYGTGPFGK
jgi:hypothetical protein